MAKQLTVTARIPEKKDASGKITQAQLGPVSIVVSTGATAAEMIQMFGDEAVASNAESNWVVTLQSNMRSGLKKGETQEQLQARLGSAKMGVATAGVKVDAEQAYLAKLMAATPADRAKMIEALKAKAAGK